MDFFLPGRLYATLTPSRSFVWSGENLWVGFGRGTGKHVKVLTWKLLSRQFQQSSGALVLRCCVGLEVCRATNLSRYSAPHSASSVGEAWDLGLLYRGRYQRSALLSPPKFKNDISPLRTYQKVCFFGLLSTRKLPCQLLQNKTFYPNKPSLTIGAQANNVTLSVKRFHVFSRPGVQDCVWKKVSYYREKSTEEHKRKIECLPERCWWVQDRGDREMGRAASKGEMNRQGWSNRDSQRLI